MTGTVYVLHFDRVLGTAQHYTGWTSDLPKRLYLHSHGTGSSGAKCTRRFLDAGIGFTVALTIGPATTRDESRVKKWGAKWFCPLCGGDPSLLWGAGPDGRAVVEPLPAVVAAARGALRSSARVAGSA